MTSTDTTEPELTKQSLNVLYYQKGQPQDLTEGGTKSNK